MPIAAGNHFRGSPVSYLTTRCLSSCVPTIQDPVDLRFWRGFVMVGGLAGVRWWRLLGVALGGSTIAVSVVFLPRTRLGPC
ncbi:hypothetical protein RHMOL_Rhmol07G0119700 [Rhododendron molle]|uniref:Uncharacterized protein n=1 Tax=Rhododendron molle TaxID=49168 RepID=A0ACC0MZM1_RHOML|nr:hypothetical protein RHMOL_Rhmol07G0119700 [Rhododendron molle]